MYQRLALALLVCSVVATLEAGEGPKYGIWHIDGHTPPLWNTHWINDQIAAGLPMECDIRMVATLEMKSPKRVDALNASAPVLSQWNGHEIVLRMNNIGPEIDRTIPRLNPTDSATAMRSHMVVVIRDDGTFNEQPTVSPWAGSEAWETAGRLWATSAWMSRLQQIIPAPGEIVILRENNEGGRLQLANLWHNTRPKRLNSKGTAVWAEVGTPFEKLLDPVTLQPLGPEWTTYVDDQAKLAIWRWKSDAELDTTVDIRAKNWVAPKRLFFPPTFQEEFYALENAQYAALYAAFDANSAPGWQGKLRTVGYGGFRENRQNDAASPPLYLGYYRPKILTDPAYLDSFLAYRDECDENETRHPDTAWREYSIAINKGPIYEGALPEVAKHAAVDPESYGGLMRAVAWLFQKPGVQFRAIGWESYRTTPAMRLFSDTDLPLLESIGRSDLLAVTIGDYELAVLRAFDLIHKHPVINRYYVEGTTELLQCDANDPLNVRVIATATTIAGEERKLLHVWTPCNLTGELTLTNGVETWMVPGNRRSQHYLTPIGLEELN